MNLQPSRDPWSRLVSAARDVRDERATDAPYGFSTRVAALAFTRRPSAISVLERFALRAVGIASVLAIGSVVTNYREVSLPATSVAATAAAGQHDALALADDTVALVVDVAD